MKKEKIVDVAIKKEYDFFKKQQPGSKEYIESQKRLCDLENLKKNEKMSKKDIIDTILRITGAVTAVVVPIVITLLGIKEEKDITFGEAARDAMRCLRNRH